MANAVERRIFVVGVPRSGTSLVQSMLAAHSTATSFTESHLFSRHFRQFPFFPMPLLVADPVPRLREFLSENAVESPTASSVLDALQRTVPRAPILMPLRSRRTGRLLLRAFDKLATTRGASCWVEKTPQHLRYIPFFERLREPGSRTDYVHVIREGPAVVSSLHLASKHWDQPYDLETCARRWNRDMAYSRSRASRPYDHYVFYEDLVEEPETTMGRLLDELGLEREPDLLDRYPEAASRLVTDNEAVWKSNVGGPVRRPPTTDGPLTKEPYRDVANLLHENLYAEIRALRGARDDR